MNAALTLDMTVAYGDVDRDQLLLLPGVFKFLQEAAIKHADQFDAGTRAMVNRGESWVLNRLAATIHRYPRYEEAVRVVTWSSGIRTCKGYRDFRVFCGEELVAAASSLWLYVSLKTRSLVRIPEEIAIMFPSRSGEVFRSDLDKLKLAPPAAGSARSFPVSVRYSDVDGNGHVNNTAYLDYLQTALVKSGLPARPRNVEIQFLKEIPPESEMVAVSLDRREDAVAFRIGRGEEAFALGVCRL
ncbi:MAG: thioesterase [Opitutaceae bacterium]|nr:thioesterase [Opitutaceae bacterium]